MTRDGRELFQEAIDERIEAAREAEPIPAIAIIGFTGVGKSSTLNSLFNAGRDITDVRPCPQEAEELHITCSERSGSKGSIRVWDMPGIGESIKTDRKRMRKYLKVLPTVDVAVWVIQADFRAMTPMQQTLRRLKCRLGKSFVDRLVFVINKADIIAPEDWNEDFNVPSRAQQKNIKEFEKYVRNAILEVLPTWKGDIVTYSAKKRYRLDQLLLSMVKSFGVEKRRWTLSSIADVADSMDLMRPAYRSMVEEQLENRRARK